MGDLGGDIPVFSVDLDLMYDTGDSNHVDDGDNSNEDELQLSA